VKDWSVYIQVAHNLERAVVDDLADELVDLLRPNSGSVSYDAQVIAGRFDVRAADPETALVKAHRVFAMALRKAKFPGDSQVIAAELETIEDQDRRLAESNVPLLVGVKEVASTLGVSKQRVSELSKQPSFPHPIVSLAAGPVWDRHSIARFLQDWERRRTGRPSKQAAHAPNFAEKAGR